MAAMMIMFALIGTLLRVLLFRTGIPEWLRTRKEVVTPLTSWDRVLEGISLQKQLISPYAGDIFHETPILLRLLRFAQTLPGGATTVFIITDIAIGIVLHMICMEFTRHELKRQTVEASTYSPKSKRLLLTRNRLYSVSIIVYAIHFLGPYSICSCLAYSTAVFSNLALLFCWLYTLQGNITLSCLSLAVAAYQSLYPVMCIVPVAIQHYLHSNPKAATFTDKTAVRSYIKSGLIFAVYLAGLLGASFILENRSLSFVRSTYGFILSVPDLTPNIGIFWYFFTEMFEHFRTFFVCVFQINVFIYTIPLAVKLRERPLFQLYVVLFVISIFKSYPSYADTALCFSLLPLWKHVFGYLRNGLVVSVMYAVVGVLAPILWHLWIYAASANANFYFAITLVFSTAQIFLLTDLMFAFLRYEYDLRKGTEHHLANGEKTTVVLD